jgi:hypothetical protein
MATMGLVNVILPSPMEQIFPEAQDNGMSDFIRGFAGKIYL